MNTVVVDSELRVRLPTLKPGQVFAWEMSGEAVKLTPVNPAVNDVPVVKMVQGPNGLYRLPSGIKLSHEEINAAIRADRDSR